MQYEVNPTLSVVVPVYNPDLELLKNTFISLKAAIEKYLEYVDLIVVNDHSSIKNLKEYLIYLRGLNIKYIENKRNQGVTFCRNIGFRLSKSDFVLFL